MAFTEYTLGYFDCYQNEIRSLLHKRFKFGDEIGFKELLKAKVVAA